MQRLAWFRFGAASGNEDSVALVAELAKTHHLDLFGLERAHDFPWRHDRQPYDAIVYELTDDDLERVAAYALHYPGIAFLRTALADDRLLASPLVVVHDELTAERLRERHPDGHVHVIATGVTDRSGDVSHEPRASGRTVFGISKAAQPEMVARALQRARDAGSDLELVRDVPAQEIPARADVVLALQWSAAPQTAALLGMAAGKPVIVLETEMTAAWPTLDPQTWQPRDVGRDAAPIAVSIDLRDEEHSLMLAMKRLAADAELRNALGTAAREWWRRHATLAQAVASWEAILARAAVLASSAPQPVADGTERARAILEEFGVGVDFLE